MCKFVSNKDSIAKHSQNQATELYRGMPQPRSDQTGSKKMYNIVIFVYQT